MSWPDTLVKYAGRLHRLYEGKHEVRIFDYVDCAVPMLASISEKRRRGCRAIGCEQASPAPRYDGPANEPVVEWVEGASPPFNDRPRDSRSQSVLHSKRGNFR